MEIKDTTGTVKRRMKRLKFRDDLYDLSGGLDQYRDFIVSQIDATADTVEFTNGIIIKAGEAYGDLSERDIRRIQIRSEEHTSELQSLMRISYAVFCLKKKKTHQHPKARKNTQKLY